MSDKTPKEKKISFRLNDYLYRFIIQWSAERKIEISEAVRAFCQNYYMDYMNSQLKNMPMLTIDDKRDKFLSFIHTIGVKDMKRVLQNPEVCATMNGMMDNGRNNRNSKRTKAKKKPASRA